MPYPYNIIAKMTNIESYNQGREKEAGKRITGSN